MRAHIVTLLLLFAMAGTAAALAPVIISVSQNPIDAGGVYFLLQINGTGFSVNAFAQWNGKSLDTRYQGPSTLLAVITPENRTLSGKFNLTVVNGLGLTPSVPFAFYVNPVLFSISPAIVTAGSAGVTITGSGVGFTRNDIVVLQFSGQQIPLATTYVNDAALTAVIPASALSIARQGTVQVVDSIGSDNSAALDFSIRAAPAIVSAAPSAFDAGGPFFTMTVSGTGFVADSAVYWGATSLGTAYVDATQLRVAITPELRALSGKFNLMVTDRSSAQSNLYPIAVAPVLSIVSPSVASAGGGAVTIVAGGLGFTHNSVVVFTAAGQQRQLATTYVSSLTLTAVVPADVLIAGSGSVQVLDSTGGGLSAALVFAVRGIPAIASASPNPVDAGGPAFTLTISGSNFAPGSVVNWSGAPLGTSVVSATQIAAAVEPNQRALSGKFNLTISDPNGFASNSYAVVVSPVLSTVSPASARAAGPAVTVAAAGIGFTRDDVLVFTAAGVQRSLATTFASSTSLTAIIPAEALATVRPATIHVLDVPGGGRSAAIDFRLDPPAPVVTAISPNTITAGVSTFTLTVTGTNFASNSTIQWSGTALATTFFSATQLMAIVAAAMVANPGTAAVWVVTANASSGVLPFSIGLPPLLRTLSPSSATAGTAVSLTIVGANFLTGAAVQWNGSPVATTFVSSGQLTAFVPANLLAAAGSAGITASNPGGGASSNTLSFTIDPARPTVATVSPTSAAAGTDSLTLTVTGSEFAWNSTVRWNGSPLATTFAGPAQMTASVPASRLALPGAFAVTVLNASGLDSNSATVTITASAPIVSGLAPASAIAGGPDFTLTVTGKNFIPGAVVEWNGAALATTFVDALHLTAAIAATKIGSPGAATVKTISAGMSSASTSFTISLPSPVTAVAGVANAASPLASIAPGSLISIFGEHLAGATLEAKSTPLALTLAETSVLVNGTGAPILFVSDTQVNAQMPFEIQPGTATLTVQAGAARSAPVKFEVTLTGPGVVTNPGSDHAVAQNWPGGTLNSPEAGANPGEYCTLYVTGQGALDRAVPTGAAAPADPLALPLAPVEIWVGDQAAQVTFAGLAPGFVGVLQVNILIPDVAAGEQPLRVTIGGVSANSTVLSIR